MAIPILPVLVGGAAFALGAAIMFVLDPDEGRRRRALARDKAVRYRNTFGDLGAGPTRLYRRVQGRARGLVYRARAQRRTETVNDQLLAARIRSRLGHIVDRPDAIIVQVDQGDVRLTGTVAAGELAGLISAIRAVPGVEELSHEIKVRQAAVTS